MSSRFRVAVALLVSWVVVGVLSALAPVSAQAAVTTAGGYASLSPSRLLDTRIGVGAPKAAVAAYSAVQLQVTGRGGVPVSGVSAVVLNVTVTAPAMPGYVSVYGAGATRPAVSNLNFVAGQTVPNLVVAPVGTGGRVALFNGSAGTVQLVADVSGYYLAGDPVEDGTFGSLTPSRVLDTRAGVGAPAAAVAAGGTVALQVTGRGGVPDSEVSAVVLNVTVTEPTLPGYLTVYGDGTTRPTASNLNFVAGQSVPNLVIAPVGVGGKVALYNGSAGTVHLVADVSGYYLAGTPDVPGAFGALASSRVLDTRAGVGAPTAAVVAGGTVRLKVAGRGGVPAFGVSAVVVNVTATRATKAGYVSVYADAMPRPGVSNLNFVAGQTVPNLVIAPVGPKGTVDLYNGSAGAAHLIGDVAGYYLSDAPANGYVAYGWGANGYGQLGDGTTTCPSQPLRVGTDTDWASVALGWNHTVEVKADGTLWAWGNNEAGQLGDGTTTERHTPARVGADTGWATAALGRYHTVALKADGTLWAWGNNAVGQLGDGTNTSRSTPVRVGTDNQWASISANYGHTVALKTDGTLWAWGDNSGGQLGDGTTTTRYAPVRVGTGSTWAVVVAGGFYTVAIKTDGTLWAWGLNRFGQLGDGTATDRHAPVRVGTDTHWASVAANGNHTLAVKTDGTLWAWGFNESGQLGLGNTSDRHAPVRVGTDTHWASVTAGWLHTAAIKTDGTLWGWGFNALGQVGDGTTTDRQAPVRVGTDTHWASVVTGVDYTIGLRW